MRTSRQRWTEWLRTRGPEVVFALGAVLMLDGLSGTRTVLWRLGLWAAIVGATALVAGRCRASEATLERVRQSAYDEGYCDGCEVSRSVNVVGLGSGRGGSSGSRLPLDRPAHQFTEQRQV